MLFDFFPGDTGQLLDEEYPDPASTCCSSPPTGTIKHIHANARAAQHRRHSQQIPGARRARDQRRKRRSARIKPGDKVRHPIFGNA